MTDSQVQIGPKKLGAVEESDEDNVDEYLGYLTFSTTGEAEVPIEWMEEQFDTYDIPNSYLPKRPSNWSAYRRAMRNLVDPEHEHFETYNEEYGYTHNCKFRLEKSDQHGSNTFLMYVDTYWPEELIGEEQWKETKVGRFEFYNPDDDTPGGLMHYSNVDEGGAFYDEWEKMANRSRELMKRYKEYYIDSDLQKILRRLRDRTNAIEIRRAVYFIGAHHEDRVHSLSSLWQAMNEFKDDGEAMRIETTPVVNLESQRELVASRAREAVEEMVENIVDSIFEDWDEEETSDEIAREMMNELGDTLGESVAEYNQLLQTKMSVKNILKEQMEEMKDEEEEVVETVLDQQELGDM